jgi:uncharacterized protein (DUF2141 family)
MPPPGYPPPGQHPAYAVPAPPPTKKRWLPWLIGGSTVLLLVCCGAVAATTLSGGDDDPEGAAPPAAAPTNPPAADTPATQPPASEAPASEAPPPPAAAGIGDGTWLVPADIKPGTYAVTVPGDSNGCYWQRSRNAEGDLDSILANDNVAPGGHVIVTIAPSDKAFTSTGCGDWTPLPESGPKATSIGEGTWAVGIDIAAGTYAVTVPADSVGCYWQRSKNFSGDLGSIIANQNVEPGARATVTIRSGDKAFKSTGCGTWSRR